MACFCMGKGVCGELETRAYEVTDRAPWARVQRGVFSAGVSWVAGAMVLRDVLLGRIKPGRGVAVSERVGIASGRRRLDAVWARPASNADVRAAILICHGIGEVVDHWARAQDLLAENGVASLVFNYAGCGRSRGRLSARQCERDAQAAFRWLRERMPDAPITLLGFSLGSGVAVAVAGTIPISGLVLCEAYPSFREALRSAGAPTWACCAVPDLWRSEEALRRRGLPVPVLVVHGERDRLFPVTMGERLARAAGERGELVVVHGMGHADLHAEARAEDWQAILARVCGLWTNLERAK